MDATLSQEFRPDFTFRRNELLMKPELTPTFLSTAQVAEGLGVGVSTVKRWVEDGILPAAKTAGGHRKLLLADVLELARRNNLPVRDLAQLVSGARGARPQNPSRLWKDLHQALVKGDASAVRAIVHGAYRNGMPIETLADDVIGPAMHRIGTDWESGSIDVMHEHRASQLCAAVLFELKQALETRANRQRPLAVGAAPEADQSVLGTLLAQMVLLDAGWDAVNLGPNTPMKSLRLAINELHPKLVWLSISHRKVDDTFRREYADLYKNTQAAGAALAIGGRALDESVRATLPYTSYGDGLTHLAAFARSLHPRPRRPKRGRPRQT
jgi:MerR family transcriptional regulator, light-induced transcriptional regulator